MPQLGQAAAFSAYDVVIHIARRGALVEMACRRIRFRSPSSRNPKIPTWQASSLHAKRLTTAVWILIASERSASAITQVPAGPSFAAATNQIRGSAVSHPHDVMHAGTQQRSHMLGSCRRISSTANPTCSSPPAAQPATPHMLGSSVATSRRAARK